jgi:heptosyltransferase-3
LSEGAVRRILVINVSRIGDTLLVTPAIRAIATAYPAARITCLGHPKRVEILEHLPFIGRIGAITKQRARLMGWLGRNRYDIAFVYGNDRPLIAYALRVARKVVAFRQGDGRIDSRLYKAAEPVPFQSLHSVPLHLALPAAIGIPPAGHALDYRVTGAEDRWARSLLQQQLPRTAGPLIGLQVASFPTKAYRDWPVESFISLCERILDRYPGAHFLIFGGALERDRTEEVHRRFPANSSLFAGRLSLRQTAALMKQVDLYIGVDTGPTHIMGALGIPMVALYHCYSPSRLIAPLEHPCLYAVDHPRAGPDCSPEVPMAEIGVDTVWEKVAAALAEHPPRNPAP